MKTEAARALRCGVCILVFFLSVLTLYPVLIMLFDAFKTRSEMAENPFFLPSAQGFTTDNLVNAAVRMKFYVPLLNSLLITVCSIVVIILISAMAAYAIARRGGKFYNAVYLFFLAGLVVPYQLAMVSLYKEIKTLGLMNSQLGMVLIYAGVFISFPVFFYSGFIRTIPRELEEAAYLDGCNRYGIFWRIVFPLLKPTTATVSVLSLMNVWNEFTLALLFLQKTNKMTLTVALSMFRGQYSTNWPNMFAGILVAVLPIIILFLAAQKQFIKGMVEGAVKG